MLLALLFFLSGHASGTHLQFRDFLPTNDWALIIGRIIPVLAGIIVLTVVFYLVGRQQERHEQRKTAILAQQKHNARETQAASTR